MPNDGFYNQLIDFEMELFGTTTLKPINLVFSVKKEEVAKESEERKEKDPKAKCIIL